ncbi:HU domain-containing protein [Costertonia aggregata]|uniref:HU-CCDC81 and SPOR domain-containing protein n=1 Tax=Costertonia aggregata TaxID=343403 RepID=A0A7H9AP30_9FLAO|nr:SPOR domain-containing protein [Costertonia aggregata]QLG45190.1 HU-CCDC81 and SPOR domain-containing protein [Costertonia aggregata]
MGIEHYLKELLYRYNCVVVPGFGAFLAQIKSAVVNESTHTLYPPTKIISFNEQLSSNDGLLVSFMAEAENTSYDEMLQKVNDISQKWKHDLKAGERLVLPNIGKLYLNGAHKIQFEPSNKINYLSSSFGLSSYVSVPVTREVLKEEVVTMEEKIPFIITPERRKTQALRPLLKYAAVALLALSTGLTGFRFVDENINNDQIVQQEAQEQVSRNIQEATFFDTAPLELPVLSLPVTKTNTNVHHIVAGAFRVRANADKKVGQLRRKGYDASYLGPNKFGLHMVAYGSYTDVDIALDSLKSIKRNVSGDAWLLSVK